MRFLITLFLILWGTISCLAQGFRISGVASSPLKGQYTLTLFLPDGTQQQQKCNSRHGDFHFSGVVDKPTFASLSHTKNNQTLFFYIENSNIAISYNIDNPQQSPITGSRSNSNYRIILEDCAYAGNNECIKQYIAKNPSSIFSPYLLSQNISNWELSDIKSLLNQLSGDATTTFHYKLLQKQISNIERTQVGQILQDFIFCNNQGIETHFNTIKHPNKSLLLVVTASWCNTQIPTSTKWQTLQINISNDKRVWDAPFLEQLAIDHIPYIMLLDSTNTIIANDLRVWQLDKYMK